MKTHFPFLSALSLILVLLTFNQSDASAQQDERKIRIANIQIEAAYLDDYKAALAEHAKIAVQVEPGVLALQAVYDKAQPTKVTVFEIYASEKAYQLHLKAPHFIKYKIGTLKMVKSLELVEVTPVAMELKPNISSLLH
jgi:quinol monooxygenase YgiN